MPVSMPRMVPVVVDQLWRFMPQSVVDIGCGAGLYGVVAREYLDIFGAPIEYGMHRTRIDAVEVYQNYITGLHHSVYDHIWIDDVVWWVRNTESDAYDMALMIDVLEHIPKDEGLELLVQLRRIAKHTFINVPYPPGPQGTVFGNPHEAHVSVWEPEDFGPCEVLEKTDALVLIL